MRDLQTIEKEIISARSNLEDNLAALRHAIREKVDVRARASMLVEKGKEGALDLYRRSRVRTRDAYEHGRDCTRLAFDRSRERARVLAARARDRAEDLFERVRERPVLAGAVIAAFVATGVLAVMLQRRRVRRRRRWLLR